MSYQQLYYTSCETGLSGYAGYQFNAVTDGTSAETMRTVEALTSYHPPHSVAQARDAAELDQCPVNLCFVPGKTTVLASVSYVGRDSSNRTGNYFAHALATSDFAADDPELLPIELWRAPWWSRTASVANDLPPLAGPLTPGGVVFREGVARFIDAHPDKKQLTALLTAVGKARDGNDPPVLVVAGSADEVTAWFAAVSYLLPPKWVRRLSFSTYLNRPSRSRLHLLGTLPETDLDLGPEATERFQLFDFPGQRFAAPPPHPLARLCESIGLLALPALWSWADTLANGREATLDEWYPVAGAAAALGGAPLTRSDLATIVGWLSERDDLEPDTRCAVARAVHRQPAVTMDIQRALRDVSAQAGDDVLWEQTSYKLLESALRERSAEAAAWDTFSAVPPGFGPAAARVRDELTATAEEDLRLAQDPADALSLLDWSRQGALRLDPDLLAECGQTMVAPLLATADTARLQLPAGQAQQAAHVTRQWREVRKGIVHYLTQLAARSPAQAAEVMAGFTGQLLTLADIGEGTLVGVFFRACDAARRGEDPVSVLAWLAQRRETSAADLPLLLPLLWPDGGWTVTVAARVLAEVDQGLLGGAADWFEAVVAAPPALEDRATYANLCAALMNSPFAGQLAAPARPALAEMHDLSRACAAAQARGRLADLRPTVRAVSGRRSAPALVLAREWVAPLVLRLAADKPIEIVNVLSQLSASAVRRYLVLARERFKHADPGSAVHAAAIFELALPRDEVEWAGAHDELIQQTLILVARTWPDGEIARTAELIDNIRVTDGRLFREQVRLIREGKPGAVVKVFRFFRRRLRARRAAAVPSGGGQPGGQPADGQAGRGA